MYSITFSRKHRSGHRPPLCSGYLAHYLNAQYTPPCDEHQLDVAAVSISFTSPRELGQERREVVVIKEARAETLPSPRELGRERREVVVIKEARAEAIARLRRHEAGHVGAPPLAVL